MSSDVQTAWLVTRHEGTASVITLTVPRLNSKIHKRADYINALRECVDSGSVAAILDFSAVRFTNHSWGFLQMVFIASRTMHGVEGQLALCGLRGHVRRVYNFTSVNRYVPAYRSVRAALRSLTGLR